MSVVTCNYPIVKRAARTVIRLSGRRFVSSQSILRKYGPSNGFTVLAIVSGMIADGALDRSRVYGSKGGVGPLDAARALAA